MLKWLAFFSQTGTEIVELSKALNRVPDLLVTNNDESKVKINPELRKLGTVLMYGRHDMLMNYFSGPNVYSPDKVIITLHGYLRILPPEVVTRYKIYNGHPALIDLFPELKGKDPQERTWEMLFRYSTIGSVVHRVNELVDDGEIVSRVEFSDTNVLNEKEQLYSTLRATSGKAWLNFLQRELNGSNV